MCSVHPDDSHQPPATIGLVKSRDNSFTSFEYDALLAAHLKLKHGSELTEDDAPHQIVTDELLPSDEFTGAGVGAAGIIAVSDGVAALTLSSKQQLDVSCGDIPSTSEEIPGADFKQATSTEEDVVTDASLDVDHQIVTDALVEQVIPNDDGQCLTADEVDVLPDESLDHHILTDLLDQRGLVAAANASSQTTILNDVLELSSWLKQQLVICERDISSSSNRPNFLVLASVALELKRKVDLIADGSEHNHISSATDSFKRTQELLPQDEFTGADVGSAGNIALSDGVAALRLWSKQLLDVSCGDIPSTSEEIPGADFKQATSTEEDVVTDASLNVDHQIVADALVEQVIPNDDGQCLTADEVDVLPDESLDHHILTDDLLQADEVDEVDVVLLAASTDGQLLASNVAAWKWLLRDLCLL